MKPRLVVYNHTSALDFYFIKDILVLNLSCFFTRRGFNFRKLFELVDETEEHITKINLCNLGTYCYKARIDYCSKECLNLIEEILRTIKNHYTDAIFVQENIENEGEVDLKPISYLMKVDPQYSIVYISGILKECLKFIGFVDAQIAELPHIIKDFKHLVPPDILQLIPMETEKTLKSYEKIKERVREMNDQWLCYL